MDADEFRDYILGLNFYKYLSERLNLYADEILKTGSLSFSNLDGNNDREIPEAVVENAIEALSYFLKSSEPTMATALEDDFDSLLENLDLTLSKLGRSKEAKSTLIAKVLGHLDAFDFQLNDAKADVLGDAYE